MSKARILEVLDYDPEWAVEYEREVNRVAPAFSSAFLKAHHIGSTSVPGIAAKPTIDMAVEVGARTVIPDYYGNMESLGYVCRGECLDAPIPGVPGRFYFVKYFGAKHLVHVHAYETGHGDLLEKLLLRDYLRANRAAASEYGILKRELVKEHAADNLAYMRGKDAHIKSLIRDAKRWAREMP